MGRTDRASLLIHRHHEEVFAALTDPDALVAWLPPAGMRGRFEHVDLRPGGSYRLVLTYVDADAALGKTTADSDVVEVRIVELVMGQRILEEVDFESDDPAFAGTMRTAWSLSQDPHGTVVSVEASEVPPGIRARDHAVGLTSSLANLAGYLEP